MIRYVRAALHCIQGARVALHSLINWLIIHLIAIFQEIIKRSASDEPTRGYLIGYKTTSPPFGSYSQGLASVGFIKIKIACP
jgi:hypothetical protein